MEGGFGPLLFFRRTVIDGSREGWHNGAIDNHTSLIMRNAEEALDSWRDRLKDAIKSGTDAVACWYAGPDDYAELLGAIRRGDRAVCQRFERGLGKPVKIKATLWRGLLFRREEQTEEALLELIACGLRDGAPISTSRDIGVAEGFAPGRNSIICRIDFDGVAWPIEDTTWEDSEEEVLLPARTRFEYVSRSVDGKGRWVLYFKSWN